MSKPTLFSARTACIAVLGLHAAWIAWSGGRVLLGGSEAPVRTAGTEREPARLAVVSSRLEALQVEWAALLLDRRSPPSNASPPRAVTPRTPTEEAPAPAADSALPPAADRVRISLERVARVESELSRHAWWMWRNWAGSTLDIWALPMPEPADPLELSRRVRLSCLTTLAVWRPGDRLYHEAVDELRREVRDDERPPAARVWALGMLRFLGPQVRVGGRLSYISTEGNQTVHGDILVPADVVDAVLDLARRHPMQRNAIFKHLAGVTNAKLSDALAAAGPDWRTAILEGYAMEER